MSRRCQPWVCDMARTGGRIRPTNRPVSAPGVGKNAKRHDLERRNVPYLQGSDLQQGDVQALEQGQRVQPIKRTQPPAAARRGQARREASMRGGTTEGGVPTDPISFLAQRIGGTYRPKSGLVGRSRHDYRAWMPLLEQLANSPGASGLLVSAYITRLHNMLSGPYIQDNQIIDMQDADDSVEALLGSMPQA